ncbi:MAG: DUF4013 domain-containing protein [Myxococcales bacterium]|nr:DUF4013 domain-containing protein [Myxococcales bacterium]
MPDSIPPDEELSQPAPLGAPDKLAPGPAETRPARVSEALSFAFDDKRSLLVGGLWLLCPVAGWLAVQGWASEAQHRLLQNHPDPVPTLRLRDFLHYARRGGAAAFIELVGVGVLWAVGLLLFGLLNASFIAAGLVAGSLLVPLAVVCGSLLLAVAVLGMVTVVFNSMLTRAELTGRLGEAVALGEAWREARPMRKKTFATYLLFVPVTLALVILGSLLCGVGVLPALVAIKLTGAHLRYQLYEERLARGGKALPARAPAVLPSEAHLGRVLSVGSGEVKR